MLSSSFMLSSIILIQEYVLCYLCVSDKKLLMSENYYYSMCLTNCHLTRAPGWGRLYCCTQHMYEEKSFVVWPWRSCCCCQLVVIMHRYWYVLVCAYDDERDSKTSNFIVISKIASFTLVMKHQQILRCAQLFRQHSSFN